VRRGLRPPFYSTSVENPGAALLASASAHACLAGIAAAPAEARDRHLDGPSSARAGATLGARASAIPCWPCGPSSASASRGLPNARSGAALLASASAHAWHEPLQYLNDFRKNLSVCDAALSGASCQRPKSLLRLSLMALLRDPAGPSFHRHHRCRSRQVAHAREEGD
jgi:hypothetical protein